jgi:cytochrome d ubiquinol oxidase subunit II
MDADGYHGSLISLLNPYGLLTGALFVLLVLVHGSTWIAVKTSNGLSAKAAGLAKKIWVALLVVAVAFLAHTYFATNLYANYFNNLILLVVPVAAVLSLLAIRFFAAKEQYLKSFFASCLTILMVTFTGVIGLYPDLIPSSMDPEHSLTIFNSSSSVYTLKIMTVVALLFVPVVIAYQIWTYRVFRQRTTTLDIEAEKESY